MKVTKHRFGYVYKPHFDKLEMLSGSEGCVVYKGYKEGKIYVIDDCGTLADILEDEPEILNRLIKIYEFDSEEEFELFIKEGGNNV